MIVDDSEDLRILAEAFLRSAGLSAVSAASGSDGLGYLRNHERPDLIVLDLHMPDMDGWTFLQELRRSPAAGTPVLIYTCDPRCWDGQRVPENVVGRIQKSGRREDLVIPAIAALAAAKVGRRHGSFT